MQEKNTLKYHFKVWRKKYQKWLTIGIFGVIFESYNVQV